MKVITFASTKGGVGKSTLTFNVAVQAALTDGVLLADLDPQRSLLDLCARRKYDLDLASDNPLILENAESVTNAVAALNKSGLARPYLLVDTPGSFVDIIRDAIAGSDCVVVPVQPSPMDTLAIGPVLEMAAKLGKSNRLLFVVNRISRGDDIVDGVMARLKPLSSHRVLKIANRIDYARAAIAAKAAIEINKEAAIEIAMLWQSILTVMRKADEQQQASRTRHRKAKQVGARR